MAPLPPNVFSLGDAAARVLADATERVDAINADLRAEREVADRDIAENARRIADLEAGRPARHPPAQAAE